MKKGPGLKLGVIGVGSMGAHHARIAATSLPGVKLFAVADPNETRARQIAQTYGSLVFANYQEMLPQVDAVSIVAPTSLHFEIGLNCLTSKKHVLIEKPLAANSEEARSLSDYASSHGLVLAVGHIERFNPAYQGLLKLIKKEKILGIDIKRLSPFPERISDANVIQDMMIHDLDLLLSLLPTDEIDSIKAEGEKLKSKNLDSVKAVICFKSGIIARIETSRVFADKTRIFNVTTDTALFSADLLNKTIMIRDFKTHIPSVHSVKQIDQLTAELKDFCQSIKKVATPMTDGQAAYKAIKLAEEVEKQC